MSGTDYYRILGVPPSATSRAIREAYLDLARRLHPDRVGAQGTAVFQQVAEAYENLSDPAKRRAYDRSCSPADTRRDPPPEGLGDNYEAEPLVPDPTTISRAQRSARQVEILEYEVVLSRLESVLGASLPLIVPAVDDCPWCKGLKSWGSYCRICGGSGFVAGQSLLHLQIPPHLRDRSVMEYEIETDGYVRFLVRVLVRSSGDW